MIKFYKTVILTIFFLSLQNISFSKENFFNEGVKLFKEKNMIMQNFY